MCCFSATTVFRTSSEVKRQKPLESQQIRAKHEASRILEDVTGSPIGYSLPKSGWAANKRIPYLYYINDKKTILIILQGDITRTKVDAIVNAANEHMTGGGGVDGIIHDAAGEKLYHACKAHKEIHKGVRLPTGHSRILLSYDMSKTTYYIINTAGPRYNRYRAEECDTELRSCYKTALTLAGLYDLESVAFTAISCGIFGYPVDDGAKAALETVDKEADCVPVVVFVLWDNHIYDEWKRTAAKLNLIPIDPKDLLDNESSSTATTTNDSEDRTEEQKTTTVSDRLLDEPVTDKIEQPKVTTDSDQSTDALATQQTNDSLLRLPSVPKDEPDTQIMDSQDAEENNSNEEKPLLTTQKTAEMVDVDNEEEKSTENTEKSAETVPVTSTDNIN